MAVKTEAGRRWVEIDVVLPGTPEQIWNAFATGPGWSTWFTETTVEERVGGKIVFDFGGGMTSSGLVTSWQPPLRIAFEEYGWSEGAPPCVTEIVITGRKGGECVVRMVHSLFTESSRWDDELEGFEGGWPGGFAMLRVYLRSFAGQPGAMARAMKVVSGSQAEVWRRVVKTFGLGDAIVGDRREAPSGTPAFEGTIERVVQGPKSCELMLSADSPASIGTFFTHAANEPNSTRVGVSFAHYGEDCKARAKRAEEEWTAALEALSGA